MKKYIFKILSIFTLLLTSIFVISSPKVSAASSNYTSGYHIATQFTFTSDIDIEDGFYTIQQEILFYNGRPCDDQYEFIATKYNDSGAYKYSGTYPDGKNFSIIATPRVIESNTGSYIEAELPEAWGQIIYVTDLKEGKTINDCLLEAWRSKWVCITEPTYEIEDNLYGISEIHTTTFENAAGTYNLNYRALSIVEYDDSNEPETPSVDDSTNNDTSNDDNTPQLPGESDNNQGGSVEEDNNPSTPETPDESNKTEDNNNTNQNDNNNSNNNQSSNNNNKEEPKEQTDPFVIALIVIGGTLGFFLLYLLFKFIKMVLSWLKR